MFNKAVFSFGWFIPLFVVGLLLLNFLWSFIKAKPEKGKRATLTIRCGGRFGFFMATYPFVRVSLYEDFLVISCWRKRVIFFEKIRDIKRVGISGLSFDTGRFHVPVVFFFNREEILDRINKYFEQKIDQKPRS